MTDSLAIERLVALIDCKRDLLGRILQLVQGQAARIEREEMTTLLASLKAKQTLLGEIQKIERQLDPFREQDPDSRQWPTPDDRRKCKEKAQECEEILQEIVRREKQCEAELTRRRDAIGERLESVQEASQAEKAYRSAPVPPPHWSLVSSDDNPPPPAKTGYDTASQPQRRLDITAE